MSNCVRVDNDIHFVLDEGFLDHESLMELIARSESVIDKSNSLDWNDGLEDERIAWWFLHGSIQYNHDKTEIIWRPGRNCRSGHTWRDLYHTFLLLRNFLLKPMDIHIKIVDEDMYGGGAYFTCDAVRFVNEDKPIPGMYDKWVFPMPGRATVTST